jgi:hypothetical protein
MLGEQRPAASKRRFGLGCDRQLSRKALLQGKFSSSRPSPEFSGGWAYIPLLEERSVSTNTAAAGGNASLLSIG